jgi:hypothetical protein
MDHVLASSTFKPHKVRSVNYCRLYLQAVTISDIANASGNRLADGILKGDLSVAPSRTTWHLVNQAKPDRSTWQVLRRACDLFSTSGTLHTEITEWTVPPSMQRRSWTFYYDPATNRLLFQHRPGEFTAHSRQNSTFEFIPTSSCTAVPPTCYPVDVRRAYSRWKILRYGSVQIPLPRPIPTTFSEYCQSLDRWENLLLSHVTLLFDPTDLVAKLSVSPFRAVSDGSAVANQGTFGWVLALPDKTRLVYASGPVEGHDPQSFRSEAQGMLSIVCFLSRLRAWTKSSLVFRGTLATDNTGLVDRVHEQTKIRYPVPTSTLKPDWDLVEVIVSQVSQAKFKVTYKHVKGHQDNDTPYEALPFLAQLNVDDDKYAGQYQGSHGSYRPLISLSPTRPIALDINGKTIHRNLKSAVRDSAHAAPLFDHLCRRNSWSTNIIATIDWDAHRLSTSVHRTQRTHFVKLCHEYLPAGKIAHRNNPTHPCYCPLCKSPAEDHQHILRCSHVS